MAKKPAPRVGQRYEVNITYSDGRVWSVIPYAIVFEDGAWLLEAIDLKTLTMRTFRMADVLKWKAAH